MSSSSPSPSTPGPQEPEAQRQQTIQRLLPTCQRCRRLRRKCDTQLPTCRVCEKAGAECTFHDHALKQTLPRAYVHSLLSRIEYLEAVKNGVANPELPPQNPKPHDGNIPVSRPEEPMQADSVVPEPPPASSPSPPPSLLSFDVIIPSTSTAGRSRYWGSSSVFALTVTLLEHAVTKGFISQEDVTGPEGEGDTAEVSDEESSLEPLYSPSATTSTDQQGQLGPAAEADIEALVRLYLVSLNTLYAFVDEAETIADLQAYLALRRQPGSSCHTLHGEHAHRFFRITMMCAISCANQARYRPYRTAQCLAYYADAVTCVEEVTSEATPASLQALLLLIVFCLFYPRKGDIWKLLDYACRLTIELGYHTDDETEPDQSSSSPPQDGMASFGNSGGGGIDSGPEGAAATASTPAETSQARRKLRRSTFWGLYAIERIVGQLFGRGSDLPETIITAEYPSSLQVPSNLDPLAGENIGSNTNGSAGIGVDQPTLQVMSIGHHYRLVYLRSELFREMYLPASPPNLGIDWLKEKYRTLYAWRRELAVSDELAGVATLTCDVGYDATMCFLFQPLLMKALRTTMTMQTPPSMSTTEGRDTTITTRPQQQQQQQQGQNACTTPQPAPPLPSSTTTATALTTTVGDRNLPKENNISSSSTTNTNIATSPITQSPPLLVASDPFHSAINVLRTYEKIIRAPERSTLGTYPMTFMSAHYIYLASSTLLAHALLRLDGRAVVLRPMWCEIAGDGDGDAVGGGVVVDETTATEELDWGAFVDVSSSCLILLAWCGERWPGMLRLLGVHQKLFGRVTRELIRLGVVR